MDIETISLDNRVQNVEGKFLSVLGASLDSVITHVDVFDSDVRFRVYTDHKVQRDDDLTDGTTVMVSKPKEWVLTHLEFFETESSGGGF
jgi:hypothetical protein